MRVIRIRTERQQMQILPLRFPRLGGLSLSLVRRWFAENRPSFQLRAFSISRSMALNGPRLVQTIQVLNKHVMDWRWKAFARKIDPSQLRASVVGYLFPRMEVGLQHADITQMMCDAWMSTIILTICERGKMTGAHNINRMGFCLLADIPDL